MIYLFKQYVWDQNVKFSFGVKRRDWGTSGDLLPVPS